MHQLGNDGIYIVLVIFRILDFYTNKLKLTTFNFQDKLSLKEFQNKLINIFTMFIYFLVIFVQND